MMPTATWFRKFPTFRYSMTLIRISRFLRRSCAMIKASTPQSITKFSNPWTIKLSRTSILSIRKWRRLDTISLTAARCSIGCSSAERAMSITSAFASSRSLRRTRSSSTRGFSSWMTVTSCSATPCLWGYSDAKTANLVSFLIICQIMFELASWTCSTRARVISQHIMQ